MPKRIWILGFVWLCASSANAVAASLTLTPPTSMNFLGSGAGTTRGDIITMTGNYSLTSIGIDAEILNSEAFTFTAYVYDDESGTGVVPLAVGAPTLVTGDGTQAWFDLPVTYTLQSGQSYDIGVAFSSFDGNLLIHYYFFDSASNAPFSVGPVTVLDGEDSHCGPCNSLTPDLRLNGGTGAPPQPSTPEPGSLLLLGTGLLGLFAAIGRKRIAEALLHSKSPGQCRLKLERFSHPHS